MATPSEILTEAIIPMLVQDKLFLPEDGAKYKAKLATGSMKSEDWLLVVEKAMEKEGDQ